MKCRRCGVEVAVPYCTVCKELMIVRSPVPNVTRSYLDALERVLARG